ncbi:MAG: hypothetical protein H6814_10735, partial [Phycisphaeraceae bacterium]|nr:hypothetical protein [Phycisphaeraceae bacterium]
EYWGHGTAGCYTLCVEVFTPHTGGGQTMDGDAAAIQGAMDHGDINMDGKTDTADLGILIGNFGWLGQ